MSVAALDFMAWRHKTALYAGLLSPMTNFTLQPRKCGIAKWSMFAPTPAYCTRTSCRARGYRGWRAVAQSSLRRNSSCHIRKNYWDFRIAFVMWIASSRRVFIRDTVIKPTHSFITQDTCSMRSVVLSRSHCFDGTKRAECFWWFIGKHGLKNTFRENIAGGGLLILPWTWALIDSSWRYC